MAAASKDDPLPPALASQRVNGGWSLGVDGRCWNTDVDPRRINHSLPLSRIPRLLVLPRDFVEFGWCYWRMELSRCCKRLQRNEHAASGTVYFAILVILYEGVENFGGCLTLSGRKSKINRLVLFGFLSLLVRNSLWNFEEFWQTMDDDDLSWFER